MLVADDAGVPGRDRGVHPAPARRPYQDRAPVTDARQPAARPAFSIDAASRDRAVWFVVRLGGLAALTFGPCFTSAQSVREAAALLSFACSIGAFVSMAFARLRGEPPWQGSLNGWDEALAFVAASRLAHFASCCLA